MIITISGKAGSGKSTVAKAIAKKLKLKHYSSGDLMREMAKERGISLLELSKIAEKDKEIDKKLDERQKKLAKEDNFVIDGRLSAYFIPNADVKIFLKADDKVRAERILKDERADERSKDIDETIEKINKREESEGKRYKEYYNADYCDEKLYDFVIDTTDLEINEVVEKVIGLIKRA